MIKRLSSLLFLFFLTSNAMAILPSLVEEACFSAKVTEYYSGHSWTLTSWEKWKNVTGLQIQMDDTILRAKLNTSPHPNKWYTTFVTLETPIVTDACPQPLQTLIINVVSEGFIEKDQIVLKPIEKSKLPPFQIEAISGRLALIGENKDWYIVLDDPNARIIRDAQDQSIVTIEYAPQELKSGQTLQAKFYVGEGKLQAELLPTSTSQETKK